MPVDVLSPRLTRGAHTIQPFSTRARVQFFFRFMIEFNIMIPFAVDGWLNGGNGMMRTTCKRRDVSGKTKNAVFIHKNYCILTCLIFISIRMTAAATPAEGTCSLRSLDRVNEWMSRTERCWMRVAAWAKRTGEFNARSWHGLPFITWKSDHRSPILRAMIRTSSAVPFQNWNTNFNLRKMYRVSRVPCAARHCHMLAPTVFVHDFVQCVGCRFVLFSIRTSHIEIRAPAP